MAEALEGERPTEEVNVQLPHVGDLQIKDHGSDEENMKNVRHLLVELMDPDFGLLDKLLELHALTFPEIRRIKSERSISDRNNKLLELIFNGMKHQTLLTALTETGQKHLYNLVRGNGVYRPEYGMVWPLQERETQILDENRFNLVDIIYPCDLITRMFAKKVINIRQYRHINSLPNNTEKCEALLDILRQGSEEYYWTTVLCLRESNQSGIADILNDGGVLAQVHVSSESETEQVDAEEDHIIEAIENLLQDKTLPQYQRIRERLDLRIMQARKGKSIVFYIYCKTLEELLYLHELLTNGELKKRVTTVFDLLISKRETTVSEVSWSKEEFKKFKTYFESDQQSLSNANCQLLSTCHARTTDYLANERSMTPKINDKEQTLNTQATSNALDDSTPLPKHTQLSLSTKQEPLTETTSSSYTSLDVKSYATSPPTSATKVTSRKSQATKEVPEESTGSITADDALKSTQDYGTSEVFGTRRELGEGYVKDYAAASSNATLFGQVKMANVGQKVQTKFGDMIDCPICLSAFTEPRILPCIHTFCFECLKRTSEATQKKKGNKIPCPLCRSEFSVEHFLGLKCILQMDVASIICDMCNAGYGDKPGHIQEATMHCIECQNNYCDKCVEVHKSQKLSRNHKVIKIESDAKSEINPITEYCSKHRKKALDYYCFDCKKIVCVSCFDESHKLHDCKDVTTLDEEFRQTIQPNAAKVIEQTRLVEGKAEKQLREVTECLICMSSFTDPRMLPCIHTFCFKCLNRTAEAAEKKPGDKMPCPLCHKDFFIPADGVNGLQKNFFMESLLEFKTMLQIGNSIPVCDMCNVINEGKTGDIPNATMRCLECQDNYCDSCVKVHQFQKLSRNHQLVKIGGKTASEMKQRFSTNHCSKHSWNLNYYCADCKKIVCVSCFVESHKLHDCKDVTTVGEEFRQTIKQKAENISTYVKETLLLRNNNEKSKADFLKEIVEQEQKIHERNQELKDTIDRDVIDRHTNSLLDELSMIKRKHLKEMETGMEEIYRHITILKSFESYCTEMISKGTTRDICSSFDAVGFRADELGKEHEALTGRPRQSAGIYFQATDLGDVLQNTDSNCVGKIEEKPSRFEDSAAIVGLAELRDPNKKRRKNKSKPANSTGINLCRLQ